VRCIFGIHQRELSINDLEEGGVRKTCSQPDLDQGSLTLIQLADALADDIDQDLLVGNVFQCFFYKMACHKLWIRSFEKMER
jgi:hypothetical protein